MPNETQAAPGDQAIPKIAYLTNLYPSTSHTFIRREIQGLEALGYNIVRYAVRCGDNFVDPADIEEARKTYHLIDGHELGLLLTAFPDLFQFLPGLPRAIAAMVKMNHRSERGIVRHVAYLFEAAKLARHARGEGVTHIHVHFGTNAASVARLSYLLGGPSYSFTVHGPDEFDAPIGFSLCEKIHDARFIVAITDFCASQIMRWCSHEEWKKIVQVHCTVPEEWFGEARPVPPDSKQLICIGRLSAQKGQLLLLDAMRCVLDAGVEGTLLLVGDGEMRGEIERQIDALDLRKNVTVAGWQTEAQVRAHLLASRALAMASFAEGLPMVVMEALAMQRPVVVTHITGVPELVRQGENGWMAPPGNAALLADAMIAALTAPVEQLNEMGLRGAARVRERHSVATEVRKLDEYFRARV